MSSLSKHRSRRRKHQKIKNWCKREPYWGRIGKPAGEKNCKEVSDGVPSFTLKDLIEQEFTEKV